MEGLKSGWGVGPTPMVLKGLNCDRPLGTKIYQGSPVPCVQLGELLATQPAAAIATETCCSLNLPLLFSFSKFKCTVSY